MPSKSRYPGVKPFEREDEAVFFGRSADRDKLYEMIGVEKTVLLYSKSGLGKTSLINAGLIPLLYSKGNYNDFTVRFGVYSATNNISPKEKVIEQLQKKSEASPLSQVRELKENTISFWFKAIQISEPEKTNVLIFDQFEELFTYPEDQVTEFKKELNELIYLKASPTFRKNLIRLNSQNTKVLTDEQFNTLSSAINIRFIFSIRSDFLSFLNRLSDYLPNLQLTFYELEPLGEEEAMKAITEPSQSPGDFASKKFGFSREAAEKIIEELSHHHKQPIETFQLQIVCQYAEKIVIHDPGHLKIVPEDLGNIKDIHQQFYDNLIAGLTPEADERLKVRTLLEEKFIYEPEKRRLRVLEGIILDNIPDRLLALLTETHLIRREPYQETFTYEISHDTLVEPILKSYHLRKKIENEKEVLRQQRKKIRRISSVAIVMFVVAIFMALSLKNAIVAKRTAEDARRRLQEKTDSLKMKNFEIYLNIGNYNKENAKYAEAVQGYLVAKIFADDTLKINVLINECKARQELSRKFDSLLANGDRLQGSEATYADARQKYQEALNLDFDNKIAKQHLDELHSKIKIAVGQIKNRAHYLMAAGGLQDAREILLAAQRMDPDDTEVPELLEKCH